MAYGKATSGCTVEQLLIPTNRTATYMAPMIMVRSLSFSLSIKNKKKKNIEIYDTIGL